MDKIRVLRIITRLNIGGPTIHVVLLTSSLNDEFYESHLLAGKIEETESDMSYFAQKYGVTPFYIDHMKREIRLWKDFQAFREIYRLIRKLQPHIVHTHTAKAGMLGRLAAIFCRVPVIVHTFHGNIFTGYFGKLKTSFFILIERILASYSSKIIAISKQQKQELLDFGITNSSKIAVINLGFEFENILPSKDEKNFFRKRYNIPAEAKIIGIIGRLVPIKNHLLFLAIAEEIIKTRENVFFVIIGDGDLKEAITQEIQKRNLSERVLITGFIEDLKMVYADIDLVLLTSENEGTPVALIEAMACKKIVMSTKVGGVEDFIIPGKNGFYFPSNEKRGFVEEINRWLDNPDAYNDMADEAYNSAIKNFSFEKLNYSIRNLYTELRENSHE